MSVDRQQPRRIVPAVDRAARILALLEEEGVLSISEAGRRLNASKGAVREVLETLRYHGLVERDDDSKLYGLGGRLIRLGVLARSRIGLAAAARPYLRQLADESGETALLLRIQGSQLVIQETVDPVRRRLPVSVTAAPGVTIPLLAGACGKVVLAFGRTGADSIESDVSEEELERVRELFYAIDDEEYIAGVRGVSAPILGDDGELVGLLLVSGLSASLGAERLESLGARVGAVARPISSMLGSQLGSDPTLEAEPSV
jgi:DNA-binding IclR family transcriptional regulator